MKHLSKQQMVQLLVHVDEAKIEIEKYKDFDIKKVEELADRLIDKKSEYLAGVAGGIVGFSSGVAVAKTIAGVAIIISGPLGAALGVALGFLIFRGRGQHKLERATRKFELSKMIIENAMTNLPKDAPQEIKDEYSKAYIDLIRKYSSIIGFSFTDDGSKFDKLTS